MLFEQLITHIHLILDLILNIAKALMNRTILKSALYKYIYLSTKPFPIKYLFLKLKMSFTLKTIADVILVKL